MDWTTHGLFALSRAYTTQLLNLLATVVSAAKIPAGNERPALVHFVHFFFFKYLLRITRRKSATDIIVNYMLRGRNTKLESHSNSNLGVGLRNLGNLLPPVHTSLPLFFLQTSLLRLSFSLNARCRVAAALTSQSPPELISFIGPSL